MSKRMYECFNFTTQSLNLAPPQITFIQSQSDKQKQWAKEKEKSRAFLRPPWPRWSEPGQPDLGTNTPTLVHFCPQVTLAVSPGRSSTKVHRVQKAKSVVHMRMS